MKQPRRLFFAVSLMLGMSFLSSVLQLQGVLLTSVIDHYHLSDSAQGMASAAASAGSVVALIAAFLLIGRLKKTTLLRLALVLCGVCLVLLNLAPGFGLFVALWLLMGVGTGIIDTSLSSCMADLYSGAMATRMLNALHMVYGLSSMLWPVIYSRLMKGGLAWNRVYLCVAAFALIALTALTSAIALFGNQGRAVTADQRMPLKAMGGVLRKGAMPGLIAAIACHGMFLGGLATWINRYVSVTLGSDLGELALSFLFLGVMLSRLMGILLNISPARYVRIGGLAAGAVILLALPFQSGTMMCAATAIAGLAFGATIPCLLDLGCMETPESTLLATTALCLALYLPQIVASPIIGALESAFSLHAGIALCGVFMILCSVCCILSPLPRKGKSSDSSQ